MSTTLPAEGWGNKKGTSNRECKCGTWKAHWLNGSGKTWPNKCSVKGCSSSPTLGAHIFNPDVTGERIAPFCDACNKQTDKFDLNDGVTLVRANKQKTCEA
ncbi:hypothetical protein AB4589_18975 [Vibrio sp. 10N.222.49.A3]|uniref:hypothetical protein n=1 Tax=Vibrio TaxID=662 RepID=UPI00107FAEB7|nr:hypothetical protein [Vibrio tasmaniensis]